MSNHRETVHYRGEECGVLPTSLGSATKLGRQISSEYLNVKGDKIEKR